MEKNSLQKALFEIDTPLPKINPAETTKRVEDLLGQLLMPAPEDKTHFLPATEGALIFSSRFGIVVRIEAKHVNNPFVTLEHQLQAKLGRPPRVNNNPWVLRPLRTFEVRPFLIEICPGIAPFPETSPTATAETAIESLAATGPTLWDWKEGNDLKVINLGLLPLQTPSFPKGIPVVLDRLAIAGWTKNLSAIKTALGKMGLRQDPQNILYAPLKKALRAAWPESAPRANTQAMRRFWSLCQEFKAAGKLIAGWEAPTKKIKPAQAARAARSYDLLWRMSGHLPQPGATWA